MAVQPAAAAVDPDVGRSTSPAQPYLGNPSSSDWLGSYLVDGDPVWGVHYALQEPDEGEPYLPPGALRTKWDTTSPNAAKVPYLMWRFGQSPTDDQAAALSHLLYSWYSAPQAPGQLDPANDFRHIAYDAAFHLSKLSSSVQSLVTQMTTESEQYQGPWTIELVAPANSVVGTASTWTVQIRSALGVSVPSAPFTVSVSDGTVNGAATAPFTTTADGTPLEFPVIPTGTNPSVTVELEAPTGAPESRTPVRGDALPVVARADNVVTQSLSVDAVATVPPTGSPDDPPAATDDGAVLPDVGSSVSSAIGWLALMLIAIGASLIGVRRYASAPFSR